MCEGVKSGRSGALKPDRLGLSCKANKCSDAGAGDLPKKHHLAFMMLAQPNRGECRYEHKGGQLLVSPFTLGELNRLHRRLWLCVCVCGIETAMARELARAIN